MNNFNIIRILQREVETLFTSINKNRSSLDTNKLIVLDQLLKMFEASKTRVITDLFDAEQTVTEQESITKLKSLKTILTILLETTNWKS